MGLFLTDYQRQRREEIAFRDYDLHIDDDDDFDLEEDEDDDYDLDDDD